MSSACGDLPAGAAHRWLVVVLLLSLCINLVGIGWGLPNAEGTWAADSLPPTAPMAIAKHVFGGDPPNSGWFYFKYPLGHPLLLGAAQLPYLAWLRLTRQLQSAQSAYPYGFRDPERALSVLALVMRGVSVLMGVGVVALAYATTATLFGRLAGLVTAVLVAGCYPMVFYAHTANVDTPMLFWIVLALTATLMSADSGSGVVAAVVGIAGGMALLTKEQSIGALAAMPLLWLLRRLGTGVDGRTALRHAAYAAAGCLAVTVLFGNLWRNPSGFVNRWRFLLGILPRDVRDKYAPYQFLMQVPSAFSVSHEIAHLAKLAGIVAQALSMPVLVLCLIGTVLALWKFPRQAAIPLVLATSYYAISLRAFALLPVRYSMPLLFCLLILGGAACSAFVARTRGLSPSNRRRVMIPLCVFLLGFALLPGIEVDRLFINDSRYAAEAWLQAHTSAGARVEIYQPKTYMPRFSAQVKVSQVPLAERTVALFRERHPDFVVLSGAGKAGLVGRVVHEWQPGMPITADSSAAKEFFSSLRGGQLGYSRVAEFNTPAAWITPRINSLSPTITIFAPR